MDALTAQSGAVRIVLTPRDYAILTKLATQRFLSSRQIAELWPATNDTNHFTRIRKLVRVGLLEPLIGDDGHRLGYRLTKKGIEFLPSEIVKAKARDYRHFSYRTSYNHDVLLQRVRNVFEESPLVDRYMPEHEVRKRLSEKYGRKERKDEGYKVPDGLFDLKTSTRTMRVALELEITTKAESRYRKMFRELLTSDDYEVIIFITDNDGQIEALRKIMADVMANDAVVRGWPTKRLVYFATLKTVLKKRLETVFQAEGTRFSLSELAKTISKKATGLTVAPTAPVGPAIKLQEKKNL